MRGAFSRVRLVTFLSLTCVCLRSVLGSGSGIKVRTATARNALRKTSTDSQLSSVSFMLTSTAATTMEDLRVREQVSAEALLAINNFTECAPYEPYKRFTQIIAGGIIPSLVLVGVASNILNLLVFCSRNMRSSLVNWYLIGLSLADVVLVACSFFIFSFPVLADFMQQPALVEASNYLMRHLYPFALISQTASVWFTVLVTGHRFLGVCYTLTAQRVCTTFKVKIAIAIVSVGSVFYNVTRFFETELRPCWSKHFQQVLSSLFPSWLRNHESYQTHYLGWSYTAVMFAIPFVTLICMNFRTIRAVRQSGRLRSEMAAASLKSNLRQTASNNGGSRRGSVVAIETSQKITTRETGTTIMLIGLVFSFLLCNTLAFVNNLFESILRAHPESPFAAAVEPVFPVLIDMSNCLVLTNSTINIFIYYTFSKKFRRAFLFLLKNAVSKFDFDSNLHLDQATSNTVLPRLRSHTRLGFVSSVDENGKTRLTTRISNDGPSQVCRLGSSPRSSIRSRLTSRLSTPSTYDEGNNLLGHNLTIKEVPSNQDSTVDV